ncbi:MAG: transcription-repair coupling factor, partial [Rhodobacteraceae bacterium]|nr:transcription-repair coupling factor [Paracoccaceae bacterium]
MAERILLGGAPEGFDAELLRREIVRRGSPVIHVARDDKRMEAMRQALAFFAPDLVVLTLPAWDCLPYDRVSPNPEIVARRMATLATLAQGVPGEFVLLTTLSAAMQKLPARETVAGSSFVAQVGSRVDEDALRAYLARMGYSPSPTVTEPGDFAVRGGIVDIYPPGDAEPVRLDFFGDVLDGLRHFDPATQRTTGTRDRLELAPASEVILDEPSIARFRQTYRVEFGAAGTDDPLYEAVSAGRKHQGMEHWLGYFHARLETIFDYLPQATVMLDDQTDAARAARWETIEDQYQNRQEALSVKARVDTVYKPAAPGTLYLDDTGWDAAVASLRVVQLSPLPQPPGPGVLDAQGRAGRNFSLERQQDNVNIFKSLRDHVQQEREGRAVVIASWSEGARERLQGLLAEHRLKDVKPVADARGIGAKGQVSLVVWPLEAGFVTPDIAVISEQDVLGERLVRGPRRRKAENFLSEAQSLSPGDLVVHVDHGVGRYLGLETITAMKAPHECLALEYAGGDKLYLPVENIELL